MDFGPIQVEAASLWFNIKIILLFLKNVIIVIHLFEIFFEI